MLQIKSFKHAPCPTCEGVVEGRTDKRFCCVKCKNEHHRLARKQVKSRYDAIHRKLIRNIVVAEGILTPDFSAMKLHRDDLFKCGFDINACTSVDNLKRNPVFELVDYNFTIVEKGMVVIKRNKKLDAVIPEFFTRWLIDFPLENQEKMDEEQRKLRNSQSRVMRWNE